jgi:hypothetical protein
MASLGWVWLFTQSRHNIHWEVRLPSWNKHISLGAIVGDNQSELKFIEFYRPSELALTKIAR